jgi:hypothetical protein
MYLSGFVKLFSLFPGAAGGEVRVGHDEHAGKRDRVGAGSQEARHQHAPHLIPVGLVHPDHKSFFQHTLKVRYRTVPDLHESGTIG